MANYIFGTYLFDVDERRLLRDNEEIRLRGKLFDTLRVLVENAGKLVRKDTLIDSVWPDSVVEDNNVDYCISQLRKVFHPAKYIGTVPRYGYRFVAEVTSPKPNGRLIDSLNHHPKLKINRSSSSPRATACGSRTVSEGKGPSWSGQFTGSIT